MDDTFKTTLQQIEQAHWKRSKSPWVCSRCLKKQEPPAPDLMRTTCKLCLEAEAVEAKQYREEVLIRQAMIQSGIPTKFRRLDWEFPKELKSYSVIERGLCLTGPVGSGKTVSMCLLFLERFRQWSEQEAGQSKEFPDTWRFISFPAFVMELQDSWRREDTKQTANKILKEMAQIPFLIMDDLGAEKLTDYVRQAVYFLINEREQWERTTYLTTNFSLKQLDLQFDSRISSRIAGMCDVRTMAGHDRRLRKTDQ